MLLNLPASEGLPGRKAFPATPLRTPSCVTEFTSPYQSSVLTHPPVARKEGQEEREGKL